MTRQPFLNFISIDSLDTNSQTALRMGMRDSLPLCIVTAVFYLAFGMVSDSVEVSLSQAMIASIFIYSSPLQLIIVQSGEQGLAIVPVILALNARFALLSATLAPYFYKTRTRHRIISATLIVPPIFASSLSRFPKMGAGHFIYFLGIGLPTYVCAILFTCIGFVIGNEFPPELITRVGAFMIALLFSLMAANLWPKFLEVISFLLGLILAPLFFLYLGNLALLLGPFAIGGCMMLLREFRPQSGDKG